MHCGAFWVCNPLGENRASNILELRVVIILIIDLIFLFGGKG